MNNREKITAFWLSYDDTIIQQWRRYGVSVHPDAAALPGKTGTISCGDGPDDPFALGRVVAEFFRTQALSSPDRRYVLACHPPAPGTECEGHLLSGFRLSYEAERLRAAHGIRFTFEGKHGEILRATFSQALPSS